MNILVVEDMYSLRELVQRFLERAGHISVAVSCVAHARLVFSPTTHVLIVDVSLPDGNGLDLAAELCERCATLRTIYMSGYDDRDIVLPLNAVFLRKPFTSVLLIQALADVTQS